MKQVGLERESLVRAKRWRTFTLAQIEESIEGGNGEGMSILGQVDEGLEERRESAKLSRMRFQCDSYRAYMVSLERRRVPIQATFVGRP